MLYDLFPESIERARTAIAGYAQIFRRDLSATDAALDAARERLAFSTDLATAVADAGLVIEAVPENADIKRDTYRKLAPLLPVDTILATNTSTLLPRELAEATGRPDRYVALHFANLIWANNLAEVMGHPGTSLQTYEAVTRFAIEIGMAPIPVGKENHGFVLNAWLDPMLATAQTLITEGVTTPEVLDRTYLIPNRGAQHGPCAMMGIIGMKTTHDVFMLFAEREGNEQWRRNGAYPREHFIDKGHLGMRTGRGYYTYPDPAYTTPGFLDVPELADVAALARQAAGLQARDP